MILTDIMAAFFSRLLAALDVDGPRMRVYLAKSPHRTAYPYNVDCSVCRRGPLESIDARTTTITMASTIGLANEKACLHLVETHGWQR